MDKKILILTPFRNEAHSIPIYLKSLRALKYPRDLIEIFWLENDSSDETLSMLEKAQSQIPFKKVILGSIKIHGSIRKPPPGGYRKNPPQARGRVAKSHMTVWNDHFLPYVRVCDADYVLTWFADTVPPPDIITEYLKVFDLKPDTGQVGGRMYRRYPRYKVCCSPLRERAQDQRIKDTTKITRVNATAHCWMNPREVLAKTEMYRIPREMYLSIFKHIEEKQKLAIYFQPSVYLLHVSTDGKIHTFREDLNEERFSFLSPDTFVFHSKSGADGGINPNTIRRNKLLETEARHKTSKK